MKSPIHIGSILLALLLIFASSHVVAQDGDGNPQSVTVKQAPAQKEESAQISGLDKIGKRFAGEHKTVDIFKGKSWYVAPPPPPPAPPPPAPQPPPAPTAPPVPYVFMGSYQGEDGRTIIFLTRGDRVFSVSPGDVIEGTYRVDGIASGQLVLIYLPLNTTQKLSIGEAS